MKKTRLAYGFFRADLDRVCALARDVYAAQGVQVRLKSVPSQRLDVVADCLPTDGPPGGLFFRSEACGSWTGLLSKVSDGWYTLVSAIAAKNPDIEAIFVRLDWGNAKYCSTVFELFCNGESIRRIQALRDDGGWSFINRGVPQSFEDVSFYSRRSISDRLNFEVLQRMLMNVGVDLEQASVLRLSAGKLLET